MGYRFITEVETAILDQLIERGDCSIDKALYNRLLAERESPDAVVGIIDAGRWQCYSGTGANEAIEAAVRVFEADFNPTTWDEIENAVRGLYEREFMPRAKDGATDTEPRCAIQDYGQELAARKGIYCPYDEWEGWL